ncbi:hypothetical protein PR048_011152 [Dryococelus australis]|uniref:Uncharacterized protein n=1 Tax=Dryococelus australis TaxID=614101 RepID=A0ABQ9HKR9_9NEOP|nr:hypothetical protein PR048_011152 [Dryococelus australis]
MLLGKRRHCGCFITLRSVSRKAYVYMRNKVGLQLPGLSTIRKWTINLRFRSGTETEVLTALVALSKIMNEIERLAILSFDETNVDSRLCYDQMRIKYLGRIQMYNNYGSGTGFKVETAYIFMTLIKTDKIAAFEVISELEKISFSVLAFARCMGGSNIGLWKERNIYSSNKMFENPHSTNPLPCGTVVRKDHMQAIIENTELKLFSKLTPLRVQLKGNTHQEEKFAVQWFSHHTATRLVLNYPEQLEFVPVPIDQTLLGSELPLLQGACVESDGVRQKPNLTSQMFAELILNATENKDEEKEEVQEKDVVMPLTRSWEETEALRYIAGYFVHASKDERLKKIEGA